MSTKDNFMKALKEITGFDEAPQEKSEKPQADTFRTERPKIQVERPTIKETAFASNFTQSYKQITRDGFGASAKEDGTNIPKGMRIFGNVESKDRVEMYGRVEGDIITTSDAVITGAVIGNIEGKNLLLQDCKVKGNLKATGDVVIEREAVVLGNVGAENLKLDGKVKGDIVVAHTAELTSDALVNGNLETSIISTSVGTRIRGSIITRQADGFDEDAEFNIEV